ncbi:MAG: hypothetical protein GQ523_03625 [Methanophagales archaeon]|jgi:DNA-binding PadR family transcriptional regulator|nr:hypothetical protein [Methanophagales archaeon]
MQGEDPKMEKFSKFLEGHIKVLPDRGAFVSLWFLSLQEMTKEENFERVKKSFGRRFPVGLEDKDYETIYAKLEKDHLVESVHGKLRLTDKGRKELNILAEKPVAYIAWTKRKFLNARKIDWYAEGL